MAAQNMGQNMGPPASPWLTQPPQPTVPTGDEAGGGQPVLNPDTGASNPPGVDGSDPSAGPLSPLASLDTIRNALPDVPGNE